MKAIAGSILILAASIILAPAIVGGSTDMHNAGIFAYPTGVVGVAILVWGLFGGKAKKED